ncbi:MAG: RNA polymerase sporulation sigma factor SigE, partial [Desulfocucumaceae bacterium]
MWRIKLTLRLALVRVLRWLGEKPDVYYVGSSEALPPPLSNDEELFLINKLESGDGAVRSVLIE